MLWRFLTLHGLATRAPYLPKTDGEETGRLPVFEMNPAGNGCTGIGVRVDSGSRRRGGLVAGGCWRAQGRDHRRPQVAVRHNGTWRRDYFIISINGRPGQIDIGARISCHDSLVSGVLPRLRSLAAGPEPHFGCSNLRKLGHFVSFLPVCVGYWE